MMQFQVIEWCTHHKNEPVKGADIFEGEIEVSQWDHEFLRVSLFFKHRP